jgi:hypothetical protein
MAKACRHEGQKIGQKAQDSAAQERRAEAAETTAAAASQTARGCCAAKKDQTPFSGKTQEKQTGKSTAL